MMKRPDSSFLLQVSGLRQGSNWQDVAWGLFMSKYIFPGADASTPLHWYVVPACTRTKTYAAACAHLTLAQPFGHCQGTPFDDVSQSRMRGTQSTHVVQQGTDS